MKTNINVLGIETSCDETAAAIVRNGSEVLSDVVSSQIEIHQKYGGVVPEIASRAHIEKIYPIVEQVIQQSGLDKGDIDAVAVANQPGLTVALIVGLTAAKTLALVLEKPLIAINHIHAHLQSAMMDEKNLHLPAIALVVSGGHTSLYECKNILELKLLGSTIDDAAGEAFDKVASILNLPYPGGPSIEKAAKDGNPKAVNFPRTMLAKDSLDFSFSGLKTAVLYHCCGQDMKGQNRVEKMSQKEIADIAASFQAAVIDVLVRKTELAADKIGAETILLGGGVAANSLLRSELEKMAKQTGRKLLVAPKKYCTDNAVMVASLGYYKYKAGLFADMTLEAKAGCED
ncbi:MAG: tRNA (adenosine(37)-N6)-threonylcarbamoyltransferase complex transferase subunit TsaD [Planctomycetes bacterium]|nr:tRNA (adenosine(37)-N6)-threonylcarbamoyltransferase complex transferase subunit TsaD [Planctomycetota bacterium]MBU1517418.1 tRNA (adenosine(37)-N6)-threonylcarbamoyltransferase complex transferase subunit TsaD [Planctomycetota bacterium]MBU2457778.1 tRNA (adenosine(37)-N6)-threonylcarbamoyltransferase complex transferase subunit TsaD [Planctomycetota bacterium]